MPNECSNHLTITSTCETDIVDILQEFSDKIQNVSVTQSNKLAVMLDFITAWKPDIQFIDAIVDKYPLSWIKNEWISEDGKAGVWVGSKNNIKYMDWDDLSIEDINFYFHK
tara:strand:- start:120 stop:452 length:333 start_codon:yes stop_codon:yes gene_type:complete